MALKEIDVYGLGLEPKIRRAMAVKDSALSGDIVFRVDPATVAPAPTAAAWTRTVQVYVENAVGDLHEWLSKTITISIADTSTAGTASIVSTDLVIEGGRGTVVVSGDEADWLNTETDTLTIAEATILGYTVAAKTSVETFTA